MEEQLSKMGYREFIEGQIENSEDVDLQLTELAFSLGLIQTENEEKIKHAQKSILEN